MGYRKWIVIFILIAGGLFVLFSRIDFNPHRMLTDREKAKITQDLASHEAWLNSNAKYAVWKIKIDDIDPRRSIVICLISHGFWNNMGTKLRKTLIEATAGDMHNITKDDSFKIFIKDKNTGILLAEKDSRGTKIYE